MPKDPTQPREEHRSFTLRVPMSMYQELGALAIADGVYINQKANQLLLLGMGKHVSLDAAVARLIKKEVASG